MVASIHPFLHLRNDAGVIGGANVIHVPVRRAIRVRPVVDAQQLCVVLGIITIHRARCRSIVGQQVRNLIDAREKAGTIEDIGAQNAPAVGNLLPEIRIAWPVRVAGWSDDGIAVDEAAEPDVFNGSHAFRLVGPIPAIGLAALKVVGVAEAQVPVPDRLRLHLPVAILAVVTAQAIPIDLLGELDNPVLIDERVDIDVGRVVIGAGASQPVGSVEVGFKAIQVAAQPRHLRMVRIVIQIPRLGLVHLQAFPRKSVMARRAEVQVTRAVLVLFEHVTARDGRLVGVRRRQLGDIHPIVAHLDLLNQQHHAVVIARVSQLPAAFVAEDFHETTAHGVVAHLLEELERQEVVHHALVCPRIAQLPIRLRRHAEDGHRHVILEVVVDLHVVRSLWPARGGLTEAFKLRVAEEIRRSFKRRAPTNRIEDHESTLRAVGRATHLIRDNGPPLRAENQYREVGVEGPRGGIQQDEIAGTNRAREKAGLENAGFDCDVTCDG